MSGFAGLAEEIGALCARGPGATLTEAEYDALALRVFAHQYEHNLVFRGFCRGRGATPDTVAGWRAVPAVPNTAFREVELVSGGPHPPEAVFVTSGTTGGSEARGRHVVPSLALYRASCLAWFEAHLLPRGERLPLLSFIPSPAEAPSSSLSTMMGFVAEAFAPRTWWLADPERGVDADAFLAVADRAVGDGAAVLVAGTAFSFVHLLDGLEERGRRVSLPEGSRLMETGGFKGRSREVERSELYAMLEERLGIPRERIVNEYGMTELLSQLYEPVLREGTGLERAHAAPPWMRVHALDPATLAPLPAGAEGLLAFHDLANLGSLCHVLTQDLGAVGADGRVRLAGRVRGAEPRGCSLALEAVLAARGGRP